MEELLAVCDSVVQIAVAAGADDAEAFVTRGKYVNVDLQKNDLQIAKAMSASGLGVRVFRNGSLGFSFVNSLCDADITESVDRAVAIAAAAPPDEYNGLPEPTSVKPLEGIYDAGVEEFSVDKAVELALAMLGAARDYDSRVTVDSGTLAVQYGTKAISSSKGVRVSERSSLFYCLIMGMAREDGTVSSFDYQLQCANSLSRVDPEAIARKFAQNVVSSLGAVKGESFKGPIILSPKAVGDIVSYPIEVSVRAASVQKGTSKFAGKLGERVASEILTAVDDATLPDGFHTTSFDREGLAPRVLPLIENGVLRNFLYDSYTARKEGRASTGHAGGGARSVPSSSPTNVVFSAGETSLQDMISGVDKGVLVTRFSGNVDPTGGDFSGAVKGGRLIEGGVLSEPLCGTMIAGNTFDLLHSISAVSRERERSFALLAPYVRMDDVTVTSG